MGVFEFKRRTKLGRWIDRNRITQVELEKITGKDKNTIYRMCNDLDYQPQEATQLKVISKLRKAGYDVIASDFW